MYKTILVHVDQSARCAERIDIAARLALMHEAHLVGAAPTGLPSFAAPIAGLDPSLPVVEFPVEALRAEAGRALDRFEARVGATTLAAFERRLVDDEVDIGLALQARYADLVVLGQDAGSGFAPLSRADPTEYVLLNCARPVLVVPAQGQFGTIGDRVTVAWNGSVNAIRAITSAIPLLKRARHVGLVVFNAQAQGKLHGELPGADIALYLARHGIRVEVSAAEVKIRTGEALLAHAADTGADLIVMGAYGHSRFREILLGGTTRWALRRSPLPLWMAH